MSLNRTGLGMAMIIFVIAFIILPSYSIAAVFDVTNEDELRQALNTAESNGEDDVINIAAGLYITGGETLTFESDEDFSLAIEGEGAGLTILDGGEMTRVMEINTVSGSDAEVFISIKGLTIQNGFHVSIPGDISESDGAGIYAVSQNVVTIEDCEFLDNRVSRAGDGGGLYADAQNIALLENLFSGNSAAFSGGGAYISARKSNLSKNVFESNSAEIGDGGGAYISVEELTMSNNEFIGNSSGESGGGLFNERSDVLLTNNIFAENSSGKSLTGGGAAAQFYLPEMLTITNNTFTLNFIDSPCGALVKCGALSIYGIPNSETNVVNIYNNIVFGNDIIDGVDVFVATKPLPVPTPLPGETVPPYTLEFGTLNIFNNDYSVFRLDTSPSGCDFSFVECILDINEGNNINEDPLFVDAEAGDVSLQPGSPCIDAGDPNAPDLPITDFFGNPRVPPPDMGAVEFIEIVADGEAGGGCSIAHSPVTSSLAVFIAIPVLILMRRIVKKLRV